MKKEGYTRLKHDISKMLFMFRISSRQKQIIIFISRMTTGCGGLSSLEISAADLSAAGIHKSDAGRQLRALVKKRILLRDEKTGLTSVNQAIEEWQAPLNKSFDEYRYGEVLSRAMVKLRAIKRQFTALTLGNLPSTTALEQRENLRYLERKERKETLNKINKGFSHIGEGMQSRYGFNKKSL